MQFNAEYSNQYAEMLTVAIIALALPSLAFLVPITIGLQTSQFIIDKGEASALSNITAIVLIIAYMGYLGWTVFKFRDIPASRKTPRKRPKRCGGMSLVAFAPQAAAIEEREQRRNWQRCRQPKRRFVMPDRQQWRILPSRQRNAPTPYVTWSMNASSNSASRETTNSPLPRAKRAMRRSGLKSGKSASSSWVRPASSTYPRESLPAFDWASFPVSSRQWECVMTPFFVGFILLPIASNLVELSGTISTALHDRLETGLAVTAGSAIQVALLVAPLLVLISHIIGLDSMNLIFGKFILVIFALVAYLFQIITVDGETTWLEGLQLISFFAVMVIVSIFANSPHIAGYRSIRTHLAQYLAYGRGATAIPVGRVRRMLQHGQLLAVTQLRGAVLEQKEFAHDDAFGYPPAATLRIRMHQHHILVTEIIIGRGLLVRSIGIFVHGNLALLSRLVIDHGDCQASDSLAAPGEAQSIRCRGFDTDRTHIQAQVGSDGGAHFRDVWRQFGPLGHDRGIDIGDLPAMRCQQVAGIAQKMGAGFVFPARIAAGKCWPISPRAAAPSSASTMAWSTVSASEWPSRPCSDGMITPPSINGRPVTSAWTS